MKIKKKSVFERQGELWNYTLLVIFMSVLSLFGYYYDKTFEFGFYVGYSLFIPSVLVFISLLVEIVNPIDNVVICKFKKSVETSPFFKHGGGGYKIIFNDEKRTYRFRVYYPKDDRKIHGDLNVMLRKDEVYRIRYLTKSKTIIEIINLSCPEVEKVIENHNAKRRNRKQRKRDFDEYLEYSNRKSYHRIIKK